MNTDLRKRKARNGERLAVREPSGRRRGRGLLCVPVLICVHLWLLPSASAQEVVVNLSAGRVVVCVARGGIVIATVHKRIEAESRPPVLAELTPRRVAVLLGATEWVSPAGEPTVRMETEFPQVARAASGGGPTLGKAQENDLESVGLAMLEPLREAAQRLVQKVDIGRDEPLLEVLLVGFVADYGPEMWSLRYRIAQDPLRSEFWQTRVLRPFYEQLYPPVKGQPRTLLETRYPRLAGDAESALAEPTLLALLQRNDPRLARVRNADARTSDAAVKILGGESHKAPLEGVTALLRGALEATLGEGETLALAVLDERSGLTWIVPQRIPVHRAEEEKKERPAGAPTLRKPPPQDWPQMDTDKRRSGHGKPRNPPLVSYCLAADFTSCKKLHKAAR
jgi:hypothetical protein